MYFPFFPHGPKQIPEKPPPCHRPVLFLWFDTISLPLSAAIHKAVRNHTCNRSDRPLYCRPPGFTVMFPGKYPAGGLQSGYIANLIGVQYKLLLFTPRTRTFSEAYLNVILILYWFKSTVVPPFTSTYFLSSTLSHTLAALGL